MSAAETFASSIPPLIANPSSTTLQRVLRREAMLRPLGMLALVSWFGIVLFDGLTTNPFVRTEGLRAIVADEMLRRRDWLVPHCYHTPLLTKPPGAYVAIALASLPLGTVQEWTARLPSAIAGALCAGLFGWHFRRRLGKTAGWVAAAMLLMSLLWLEKVPTAEIDALQVMWVTASLVLFFRGIEEDATKSAPAMHQFWWCSALLCVAAGFLTKWTAPAFFYLTAATLLWRRGQVRLLWGRQHLLALGTATAVCLAWLVAVILSTGPHLLWDTLAREGLMRLLPSEHHRAYPWLEVTAHPWRILAAALPWSAVAIMACNPGFRRCLDANGQRTWQEMHCWLWPNLIFWSIIPEHATRHSFPILPAIGGLAALVWMAWLRGSLRWPLGRLTPRHTLAAGLVAWLMIKLVFIHVVVPARPEQRDLRNIGERLAAVVPAAKTLYLFRENDDSMEGLLFYYSKVHESEGSVPVQLLDMPAALPTSGEDHYCMVDEDDWDAETYWNQVRERGAARVIHRFLDGKDMPVLIVEVAAQ